MLDLYEDFNIIGDGTTDHSEAIAEAIAEAKAGGGGGNLYAREGDYVISGAIGLNLIGPGQIRFKGAGPDRACFTYNGSGPGILIGASGVGITRKSGVEGIYIRRGDGTLPTTMIPGNYGINTPDGGVGTGIYIRDVAVVGFGDHAIRIAGPSGPTLIEDFEIYRCSGFGIVQANVGGGAVPQDVSIHGGSIQDMWGGIVMADGCTSSSVYDTDIELGGNAKYPAIVIGVCGGHSFHGVSASVGAMINEAAVVYCQGFGNTWIGGLNYAPPGVDNFWFHGSNANENSVKGGRYMGSSGYYARVQSGVDNAFENPSLGGYDAGRGVVYDMSSPNNRSYVRGVPTAAGVEAVSSGASTAEVIAALKALGIFR